MVPDCECKVMAIFFLLQDFCKKNSIFLYFSTKSWSLYFIPYYIDSSGFDLLNDFKATLFRHLYFFPDNNKIGKFRIAFTIYRGGMFAIISLGT